MLRSRMRVGLQPVISESYRSTYFKSVCNFTNIMLYIISNSTNTADRSESTADLRVSEWVACLHGYRYPDDIARLWHSDLHF